MSSENVRDLAIDFLQEPRTCTELGSHLWSGKAGRPSRNRQCYARPAGKIVKALVALGLVRRAMRHECGGRNSTRHWNRYVVVKKK